METQVQLMYIAGVFLLAVSLAAMLPLGSNEPTTVPSTTVDYANFTATMQSDNHSGDWIPFIGTIGDLVSDIGSFLGGLANLLNPATFLNSMGLPPLLSLLLISISALIVGFGIVYLIKGVI